MTTRVTKDMAEYASKVARALEAIDDEHGDGEDAPFVMKVTFGQYRDTYHGLTVQPNDFGGYDLEVEE